MQYIIDNPDIVRTLLLRHLQMTAIALGIALAIALPLGLLVNRYRWLAVPVVGILGIFYTIPSLALIILLIPAFGLGSKPVIIALIIYAQVILVRNILVGLQSVSPAMLEAARGMGMNAWQTWWRVQFPLALPIMLAGLRIAATVVIGIAAIGAKFGAGGLGRLLFDGISGVRYDKIWAGAITVSALAFAVNGLLLLLERACDPARHTKRTTRRQRAARDVAEGLTPIPG
ncbi:MAG TPA: ABC transporter permease [Thermomicrobiales bacterium]|jgi:osmoprotectant transport system permease protein